MANADAIPRASDIRCSGFKCRRGPAADMLILPHAARHTDKAIQELSLTCRPLIGLPALRRCLLLEARLPNPEGQDQLQVTLSGSRFGLPTLPCSRLHGFAFDRRCLIVMVG